MQDCCFTRLSLTALPLPSQVASLLSPTAASMQQARQELLAEQQQQQQDGSSDAEAPAEASGAPELKSALSSLNESTFETAQACMLACMHARTMHARTMHAPHSMHPAISACSTTSHVSHACMHVDLFGAGCCLKPSAAQTESCLQSQCNEYRHLQGGLVFSRQEQRGKAKQIWAPSCLHFHSKNSRGKRSKHGRPGA
jgi:hypothetical protein